jgi:hypothetical protein
MSSFKSVLDAVASPFGTRASGHPPSLAREKGKYRLSRWHPSGNRPGTAAIFEIAWATRSTGEDAWDQSSLKLSRDEKTKLFGEGERPQWSTSSGSDILRDLAAGGRNPGAGSLSPRDKGQTTKRGMEACAPDVDVSCTLGKRPDVFPWAESTKDSVRE